MSDNESTFDLIDSAAKRCDALLVDVRALLGPAGRLGVGAPVMRAMFTLESVLSDLTGAAKGRKAPLP